ncbi:hypothetical protein KJ865_09150, partial [Myxococcota bacterium]|nr:hypothetical protein [Myxococcota bacterium]
MLPLLIFLSLTAAPPEVTPGDPCPKCPVSERIIIRETVCNPCPTTTCPKCPCDGIIPDMKKILDDSVPSYGKWARPGEEMQFTIRRVIPDYHISVLGLPRGATFDPLTLTFKWTPSPLQVGTHVVLVRISLGGKSMERSLKIEVWGESDSYLYPGFRSAFLIPRNLDAHGLHYGLAFLITGYSWIKRNSSSGPSHGRLYAFLENLESVKENTGYTLHYGVG